MRRNGMTLMELLTVISILATLSAFLFPVYTQVRKRIYVTQCATQMKQIGVALKMYLHDWGSDSPYDVNYLDKLFPNYINDERLLVCPYFASMAPEVVADLHANHRKVFGFPWTSYNSVFPKDLDLRARKYPDEHISFAEMYSVLGDRVPIAYCMVHRIGCPDDLHISPKGRKFCFKYCRDPNVFIPPGLEELASPIPPGLLSDLSQPWVVLRWDGSVSLDYGGGWFFNTGEREFLERVWKRQQK